jgi:hypothetical protein
MGSRDTARLTLYGAGDLRHGLENGHTKTVDKMSGGYLCIKSGTYDINRVIHRNKVSIVGDGDGTIST